MKPRTVGIAAVILAGLLLLWQARSYILASYRFEKAYGQLWSLADKSSTITAKQQHIAQFVSALEQGYAKGEFSSHDAIWLDTPNNAFTNNLEALKTLSGRLVEIQGMNPSSFEYNTAIQQITAQEQGEANRMIGVFEGCYALKNYPGCWDWIGSVVLFVWLFSGLIGICTAVVTWDDY